MKPILTVLATLFLAFPGHSQTISFERDTVQVLQNSDAGLVASADVDLDGDMDLLITGTPPVTTTLYLNDGSGKFVASPQPAILNVFSGAAKFADVDNDGDPDLLITGNTGAPITTANLYLNDGTGSFSLADDVPFEASSGGDVDFGDIDGDDDQDLIITGKNGADELLAKLYVNDGAGTFTLRTNTPFIPVWFSATEFVDVDNDNDLDLLICGEDNSDTPITTLYLNDGSGFFSIAADTPFSGSQFGDLAFGDTDNDGDQDILITGVDPNGQNIAQFYVNQGGTFSLLADTPFPGISLHSSSFADFNSDGNLDLLLLGNTREGLIGHVYENTGTNNFILADSSLAGSYNGTNLVLDLNGDQNLDIISTGTSFTQPVRAPKIYFNTFSAVSVEEVREKYPASIFPNPTTGALFVKTNFSSNVLVEVFQITGEKVFQQQFLEPTFSLHLSVSPGTYILRLSNENNYHSERVIINNP